MSLSRFLKDRRGGVTPMFALAIVPVVGFVGASIDYSRANSIKVGMQSALDATALAMAKLAPTLTPADLQTKSTAYFNAMFNHADAKSMTITPTYTTSGGSQLTVAASASMDTAFMKLMGYSNLGIKSSSTVKWGNNRLRVALALDNTGSMTTTARSARSRPRRKTCSTSSRPPRRNNGDVYVSIVPFNKNVKVDTSNYNRRSWLDWEDWDDDNGHDSSSTTCTTQKSGKNGKSKKKCTTTTTWVPDNHNTWNGCITDRDKDYDVSGSAPTSSCRDQIPGRAVRRLPGRGEGPELRLDQHDHAGELDDGRTAPPTRPSVWCGRGCRSPAAARSRCRRWTRTTSTSRPSC